MRWESGFSFEVMWSAISEPSREEACRRRGVGALVIQAAISELGTDRRGVFYGTVFCLNSCSWAVGRKESIIGESFPCQKYQELALRKVD
jgi:hypothetical protein